MLSPDKPSQPSAKSPKKSPRCSASTTSPHLSPSMSPLSLSLTVPPLPLPTPLPLPPPSPYPTSSHPSHFLAGPLTRYPPAFSLDGRLLLLPSSSHVRLFSLSTSLPLTHLTHHTSTVTSVHTLPPNPLQALTSSLDGRLTLFDLHSSRPIRSWDAHAPILHCTLSPDTHTAYLNVNPHHPSSHAGYIDPTTARSCRVLSLHLPSSTLTPLYRSRACTALVLDPSGRYLASIAKRGLTLYDTRTAQRWKLLHSHRLTAIAFHPRDPYLATGDQTGRIHLWYNLFPSSSTSSSSSSPSSATPTSVSPPSTPVISALHWHAHAVSCVAFTHRRRVPAERR